MIHFSEEVTVGRSKHIKVYKSNKYKPNHSNYKQLKGNTSKIEIGRINFTTDHKFYYYEPPTNTTRPVLIDEELEKLKRKVINRRNG